MIGPFPFEVDRRSNRFLTSINSARNAFAIGDIVLSNSLTIAESIRSGQGVGNILARHSCMKR